MEFGNIGNYYILEPFVRELRRVFPESHIETTLQLSQGFCQREGVTVLPMALYYGFTGDDLEQAQRELEISMAYQGNEACPDTTPYIEAVKRADLVIDFSGDIWGDNADLLGKDRFLVGLYKNRVPQLLGKPTFLLAGSPGPFSRSETLVLAQEVFQNFTLVTNRESISTEILKEQGFVTDHVVSLACPAFLFEAAGEVNPEIFFMEAGVTDSPRPRIGFILCGWNFTEGPFDQWPRGDHDYMEFVRAVEYISEELDAQVVLMSHSNGFPPPPQAFTLTHGRDYPIVKQLQRVIETRGIARHVVALDGIYDPWTTKAIIRSFDMLVSGRIHGAVAGLSQYIPTVMIDYGHEPKAHKIKGFAQVAGATPWVADPGKTGDLISKIDHCWNHRDEIRNHLIEHIPGVKAMARNNFTLIKEKMGGAGK